MTIVRRPLRIERLEARDCPAVTITQSAGNLFIKGAPNADLYITGTANPSQFTVYDGAQFKGTFNINAGLYVQLTSRPGTIQIDLNANYIPGNVVIDLGNGYTGPAFNPREVQLFDSTSIDTRSTGTIRGTLSVMNGNGREVIHVGAFRDEFFTDFMHPISILGGMTVVGRASTGFEDTFQLGEGSYIGGTAQVTNYDNVTFGLQDVTMTSLTEVRGDVSVTTTGVGGGLFANFYGLFSRNLTVNGSATTSNSNSFLIAPPDPGVDSVVGGNLTVTFREALVNNQFTILHDADPNLGTVVVNGTTRLTSTNNSGAFLDVVDIQGQLNGSVFVSMANSGNDFTFAETAYIGGNLSYTGGNGENNFGANGANSFGSNVFLGTLAGALNVTVGHGTNTVSLQTGIGGKFTFRGGNGTNDVSIVPTTPAFYLVDLLFGSGTNVLTLNDNVTMSGIVRGSGGNNTFNQNDATLMPPITFSNFP